jgi:photosystem II stability/assembly factor-like uncharacterized protein
LRLALLLLFVSCYPIKQTTPISQPISPTSTPTKLKQTPRSSLKITTSIPVKPPLLDLLDATWRWQSPSPQGNSLYGLYANPAGQRFAVGRVGTILRAAPNWKILPSGSQEWLFGIWGSGSTLFVSGANGTLLRSVNNGDSWEPKNLKTHEFLFSGVTLPSGESFVVGSNGAIFTSSDQGDTWRSLSSGTSQNLYQLYATTQGVLFAVGEGGILLRSDDKISWRERELGAQHQLFSVYAERDRVYTVGAKGSLFFSSDGGKTFTFKKIADDQLNSIWGHDNMLWVAGNNGLLRRSLDAGKTWQAVSISSSYHLLAGCRLSDGSLLVVGSLGLLLTSTDQGARWSPLSFGHTSTFYSAQISATPRGWEYLFVGGAGAVLQLRPISIGSFEEYTRAVTWGNFRAIVALATGELIAVSEQGGIFRSAKGDERWVFQASTTSLSALVGDATRLTAAGATGLIVVSLDRGKTWSSEESGIFSDITGLWQSPQGVRFAVGSGGTLLRAKPKETWQSLTVPTSKRLNAIWGADENNLYIAGDGGLLLRSQDGGDSWKTLSSNTTQPLYALWGSSADALYAVGAAGTILRTANAGDLWLKEPNPTERHLYFIVGSPSGELFTGGEAGAILLSSWLSPALRAPSP